MRKTRLRNPCPIDFVFPEQFRGAMRATVASFGTSYPEETQRRALENWAANGFRA